MSSDPPATLLALVQKFRSLEGLGNRVDHPFASSFETSTAVLQELLHDSHQLSHSLAVHSSAPVSNPKLVSILRQHGTLLQSSHVVSSFFVFLECFCVELSLVARADIDSINRSTSQEVEN